MKKIAGRTWPDLITENPKMSIFIGLVIYMSCCALFYSGEPFKLGPFEMGSKSEVIDTANVNDIVEIKGEQNINGNNNILINNSIQNNSGSNQIEYTLIGTSNQILLKRVSQKKKIKFVSNSNNTIEISYSGDVALAEINSNSYYYTGGYVKLIINQNTCYEFKELLIDQMRVNSKQLILDEIQNKIDEYVNSNTDLFTKKIIECLNI